MTVTSRRLQKTRSNSARGAPGKLRPIVPGEQRFVPLADEPAVWPIITLYVNGSAESRAMFELLEAADVDLRAVPSRRRKPVAMFGHHQFSGVSGAHRLVDLMRELDAAWDAAVERSMPELLDLATPEAMREVELTRGRWRQEARDVLARVESATAERLHSEQPRPSVPTR
jgi:hypothetical protein